MPLRDHSWQRILRHQKRALQVDVNLLVPFLLGALDRRLRIKHPGIIEKNVEVAEGAEGFVDGAPAIVRPTHVGTNEDCVAAQLLDPLRHPSPTFLIAPRDRNARALPGKQQSRSLANAGSSAGDESNFILKTHS